MTAFLYLYTGQEGPISAVFLADDVGEARETAAQEAPVWSQDAEDALGLPLGASAHEALYAARSLGWTPVYPASHSPFRLFTRNRP